MKIRSVENRATETISTGLNSIGGYASHSAQRGREHFAVTLFWIWLVSLSAIALVFGIITAPTALVSDAPSSSLAAWLGLFGATGYTSWTGLTARNHDSDHDPDGSPVSRLFQRATETVLSVTERLVGGVTAATAGATLKQRALVMGGVWILAYIALSLLMMVVLVPASLVAPVSSFAVVGGFLGSVGVTAWIWQQSKSQAQTQRHHQQNTPNQNQPTGPNNSGSQANPQTEHRDQFVSHPPDMDFSDVVGMDDLKAELHDKVIDPLANPEAYAEYGLSVENGFLFYGPPGTGKTYISKCLAGELGINYISAKAGDLVSKYIGEGATNVQQMFDEARRNQPCLVFVDEIDALASDRSGQQTKSERQMVNQFLEELSEINDSDNEIIMIGATNRLGEVDSAMLRTGRFSEKIEVPPPTADARLALFNAHLQAPRDGLDPETIRQSTDGFVASDMENVAQRAARKAMRRSRTGTGSKNVTQADVDEAISEVRDGRQAGS